MSTPETLEVLARRYGSAFRWLTAATVLLGMLSSVLTTTAVNVAIPDIMGAFGMSQDRAHWLSTGALAGTSVGVLVQAWLVKRFGPRATFTTAMSLLAVSLIVAALAPNEIVLFSARIVQGAIFGLLQPLAVYMLMNVFPPDRKGQAMGMFGLVAIAGPALGPFVGGVMIELFNWRYIFYISLPTSVIAFFLGSVFLPQRGPGDGKPAQFDWFALALVTAAIGFLLVALSNGQRLGWGSNAILIAISISLVCGFVFVRRELRAEVPLVDMRPLAVPAFAATAFLSFIFGAGLFGSIYLIPLFVQTVQGLTPMQAGLMLLPGGLLLGVAMPMSGYLADRVAARKLIISGIVLFVISSAWMGSTDVNTSFLAFTCWVALSRLALALVNPALNVAAIVALPASKLATGAGLINFSRQLGGAFGVNLLAMALERRMAFHGDALTAMGAASNASPELLRRVEGLLARAGASADVQSAGAVRYLGDVIAAQAYSAAFQDAFYLVAAALALSLFPAMIVGRKRTPQPVAPAQTQADGVDA